MRGIVIQVLNALSMVGIGLAILTGVLGFIGVPAPVFTVVVGCLIGLLGGVTNLMVLLAILEVRHGVLSAGQVITVQEQPLAQQFAQSLSQSLAQSLAQPFAQPGAGQLAPARVSANAFRPIRVQYNLTMRKPHPVRDRLTEVAHGLQTIRDISHLPPLPVNAASPVEWAHRNQNNANLH